MLKHSLFALTAMAAGLAGAAGGASAFPVTQPGVQTDSSAVMVDTRSRYDRNHTMHSMQYDRRWHGNRCGYYSNNCRYHHGNYWYESPWWIVPSVGVGIALGAGGYDGGYDGGGYDGGGYGSRHVRWCMDRYRSYNPRYNTWVSYGGRVHQCVSPYGP